MKIKIFIIALTAIFTIAAFTVCNRDNGGDAMPEMKTPFVALNTALKARVVITNDRAYLNELENQLGINRRQIKKLFNYLQTYSTIDEIKTNAEIELSNSINEILNMRENEKTGFFIINILAPYLSLLVNNFYIDGGVEDEIHALFAQIFANGENETNPLAQLAQASKNYRIYRVFRAVYTYNLNHYLKKHNFILEYNLRQRTANIFKIENTICNEKEWRSNEKISVLVLTRIYPHFLSSNLGYAPAGHGDVFILKDLHRSQVKNYRREHRSDRAKKMPRIPYTNSIQEKLWTSLALDIDLVRANRIRWELANRDLSGKSYSQILNGLIIHTALHEAKHRIDEIDMPDMRLNLDMEVSAYLTTAIFGVYPFLGLRETIEWVEAYYHGTSYTNLRYLLGELWGLADKSLKENFSEEILRAELRKIYENYRTIQWDEPFINLDELEERMVPIILSYTI